MGRGARRRPEYLGMKLRQIRDGLGLSQGELIERLGLTGYINRGEISDFERGVREPDLITLKAYADGVGVSIDDLIDDDVRLPEKLPVAKPQKGLSKPQKRQAKAPLNTATATLQLQVKNGDHHAREEIHIRRNIESYLKQYEMKKLKNGEYELVFSYKDNADLHGQVYALLAAIRSEADRYNCPIEVKVRESGTDRCW